jgi:hypothetical protein
MNAKSKADFINSIAGGKKIPCPVCNALNDTGAAFCFSCGNKLSVPKTTITCPNCKEENEAGSVFCASCGTRLTPEQEPVQVQPVQVQPVQVQPTEVQPTEVKPTEVTREAPVFKQVATTIVEEPDEVSALALGLPEWSVVPPQEMVRRKKKR